MCQGRVIVGPAGEEVSQAGNQRLVQDRSVASEPDTVSHCSLQTHRMNEQNRTLLRLA